MALRQILTTLAGVKAGLDSLGNWVLNRRDGSQIVLDADATTGVPSVYTRTAAGTEAQYDLLTSTQATEVGYALAQSPAGSTFDASETFFSTSDYYNAGDRRYDLMRAAWERRVAELKPMALFQPNLGSVVYVDPSSATNGAGTFASPRNVVPGYSSNQTVLLKEGTTYTSFSGPGGVTNWLLGTYDKRTGNRVFDPARLATIDANGGTGCNISGASVNAWISGIRVINFLTGLQKGQNASASGGGIEFCFAEDAVSGVMVTCFQSFVGGSVMRFNRVERVSGDGLWYGQNTNTGTTGVQIYGNDIRMGDDDTYDGPDGIQLSSNNGEAVGAYVVHSNWIENTRNRKQCIIATYNNTLTAADSFDCYANFVFGADTSLPLIGSNAQNAIYSEIPNTRIYGNYVENSRYPIVVYNTSNPTFINGAIVYGNLVYINMTGLLYAGIEASSTAASGVLTHIVNNTIIGAACGGGYQASSVLPAITSVGPADIRNNAIVGTFWNRTIQVNNANAGAGNLIEQGNAFDSAATSFVFDSGAGVRAASLTDWVGVEGWLDDYYRPIPGTPLDYGGTPNWGVMSADIYGSLPRGAVGNIGACHPVRSLINENSDIPLLVNASANYTGAWLPVTARRLYTRFSVAAAGGGVLTATVQGKLRAEADSAATTLNTISLGGGGSLTDSGTAIDASAEDLVRVVVTGYSAHGPVNLYVVA
jgi:hypothetical protein